MNRIVNESNSVRRELPKIDGSSTAFIVVIVVLVAIIITSCSGIVYLIRQNALEHQKSRRHRRYNTQPLGDSDSPDTRKKWYSYLWGSSDRHNPPRSDKPTTTLMGHSSQGWIQTNSREWDVDPEDQRALRSSEVNQSILLRMPEPRSSGSTIVGSHVNVYTPRMHSPTSDTASSIRYDPYAVSGLPYPEQFASSPQATIPSIHSPLYSPTSSLSSSSSPVPRIMKSPEPIANSFSHDSGQDSVQDSLPSALRTFGSGTKFFESLE